MMRSQALGCSRSDANLTSSSNWGGKTREAASSAAKIATEEAIRRVGYYPADLRPFSNEKAEEWLNTLRAVRHELDTDQAVDRADALWDQIDALYKKMIKHTPHTLAGAGVVAGATAIIALEELWNEFLRDLDYDKLVTRQLIEVVCRAGGIECPFEEGEETAEPAAA